ncbi:hypothetical protein C8J57DRAFT_1212894 [Mycena rebaudengoi]|nr:hypothetical protein C8J57DRAFT_1212894 [Mycena rebaudengoi]
MGGATEPLRARVVPLRPDGGMGRSLGGTAPRSCSRCAQTSRPRRMQPSPYSDREPPNSDLVLGFGGGSERAEPENSARGGRGSEGEAYEESDAPGTGTASTPAVLYGTLEPVAMRGGDAKREKRTNSKGRVGPRVGWNWDGMRKRNRMVEWNGREAKPATQAKSFSTPSSLAGSFSELGRLVPSPRAILARLPCAQPYRTKKVQDWSKKRGRGLWIVNVPVQ